METITTQTTDIRDVDDLFCRCVLAAGDEVKVEIDDGAISVACPRCGRQVSLESVSVHAAPRTAVLTVESDESGADGWLEARI